MKTIAIAHEFPIVTLGLEAMIRNNAAGFTVAGTASSIADIPGLISHHKPDVLAVGATMIEPVVSRFVADVKRYLPETRVLVYAERSCKELADAVEANDADGYVLLDSQIDLFLEALSAVASGTHYVSPNISPVSQADSPKQSKLLEQKEHSTEILTPRETQVLMLIAEGLRNADIADRLSITQRTVEVHRARLMRKLQLKNLADLVRHAIKHGLNIHEVVIADGMKL